MKITVLDRCTVTRGDIDINRLSDLGDLSVFDVVPDRELPHVLSGTDAVICNKARITADVMDRCPDLVYIGLFATGYDNIDTKAAAERGIAVCNAPGYSTMSVAQHAFSLLLNLASNTVSYNASVQNGGWMSASSFTYLEYPMTELAGKNLGIVGYGAIGKKTAEIGAAFGMHPLIFTRTEPSVCPYECVSFDSLLERSDFISLHCPLTPDTRHMINETALNKMKPSAYIINTSRGGVIDENALAAALRSGRIAGAGIDVLENEPMRDDCPYFGLNNCIITPHVAWATLEARTRLMDIVYGNLEAFIKGSCVNNVAAPHFKRGRAV